MLGRAALVAAHDYMTLGAEHRSRPQAFPLGARPDPALQECPSGFTRRAAPPDSHQLKLIAASTLRCRGNS